MKKYFLIVVFSFFVSSIWGWSLYDAYETGEEVSIMATYTRTGIQKANESIHEALEDYLVFPIRLTGGKQIISTLHYNKSTRLIKYEIRVPYFKEAPKLLAESVNLFWFGYGHKREEFLRYNKMSLGVVYENKQVKISCKVKFLAIAYELKCIYYVEYK